MLANRLLTREISSIHILASRENSERPQTTGVHPEKVSWVCAQTPPRCDDETAEIQHRVTLRTWKGSTPSQHSIQSLQVCQIQTIPRELNSRTSTQLPFFLYPIQHFKRSSKQQKVMKRTAVKYQYR